MLDIDIKDIAYRDLVSRSLRELQKAFSLSDIYLFKTTNGYHAYCLDKHTLKETWTICKNFKYEDENHGYIGYAYRKYWVLRIGDDIYPIETIKAFGEDRKDQEVEKSNAHRMFLNQRYKSINIKIDLYYDEYTDILVEEYPQREKPRAKLG